MGEKEKEKGITLIALIITVIIMLILAGVVLGNIMERGIIDKTKIAGLQTEYVAAREIVDLNLTTAFTELTIENKEYNIKEIAKYIEKTEGVTITKYYYKNNELENLEYISVIANQYNKFNFLIGREKIIEKVLYGEVKEETKIGEFQNKTEFEREQLGMKNNDKLLPKPAIIEFNEKDTHIYLGTNAKVTLEDNENGSGIDISNCKYVFNNKSTEVGINPEEYTGGYFTSNEENIELKTSSAGTYYLHVLVANKDGDFVETISDAVNIYENPSLNYGEAMAYSTGGLTINSTTTGNYHIKAVTGLFEQLNIPINNCIIGKKYNISFQLQVTNASFINQWAYSFQISDYIEKSNSSINYINAIPKNRNVNSFSVDFTATSQTMYINFGIADLQDENTYNMLIPSSTVTLKES